MFTSSSIIVMLAGTVAALVGHKVMQYLTTKDVALEGRRRSALHLSSVLKQYGLTRLPDILGDYAVGDYAGMYEKMHDFGKLTMSGDQAVLVEFDQIYTNVLKSKMGSEEGRAFLKSKLEEAFAIAESLKPVGVDLKTAVK